MKIEKNKGENDERNIEDEVDLKMKIKLLYKKIGEVLKDREKIKKSYINCQNLIVKEFFDKEFKNISNLEELDSFRKCISKFDKYVGKVSGYVFYENYFIEMMNKLEHKSSVFENGGIETAIDNPSNFVFKFLNKLKSWMGFKHLDEK